MQLAVVIPVYNESEVVAEVVKKWSEELSRLGIDFKLHLYNDGSTDSSLEVLNNIAVTSRFLVVHDKPNSGHGPTILEGYQKNCSYEWIFQVDSDNEMDPKYFTQLWQKREAYDFLIGKRINRKAPFIRFFISSVSRLLVRLFFGQGIYDVNSPYRLIKTSEFKSYFALIPQDTFAPNVLLSAIACRTKKRIFEFSVPYNFRQTGVVSIKRFKLFKVAIKSCIQTIRFFFLMRKYEKNI